MGQFPEMFRIAEILKNSDQFNPIIYFNLGIPSSHPNLYTCLANGIDVLDYSIGYMKGYSVFLKDRVTKTDLAHQNKALKKSYSVLKFKYWAKHRFPFWFNTTKFFIYSTRQNLLQIPSCMKRIVIKLKRARRERSFFKTLDFKLMIFAEDSEAYFTPQLIQIGHELSVKSVVFPYTFANQFEFLEDAFFHDRRAYGSILNFIAAKLFPHWTFEYKGQKLLKNEPSFIFATEIFGQAPPNPWVMSSGYSDAIAVESAFMKEYYKKAGLPEEKMEEVGFPSSDYLAEIHNKRNHNRSRLAERNGFDLEKPWVVCAVPPSQWPRAGVGFRSYQHFLEEFFKFFSRFKDLEIIFKFHPRLDTEEVRRICDQYQVKFIEEDTVKLIAMGNAYVASVSSTMRWSLALGLPTINYDMYNYNYGDFDGACNYEVVVSFEKFKKSFERIHQVLISNKLRNGSSFQQDFAQLDGKAHQRILDLFQKLTQVQ